MKKAGIYTAFNREIPLEKRICAIKNAGFDFACLNFEKELAPTETTWENQLKLAQKYTLPIKAVHLTGSYANALWENNSNLAVQSIKDEISNMAKLGIKTGVLHVTWGLVPPSEPSNKALLNFLKITDTAVENNVEIAFENSVSAKHLRFVLDNIDSKNIGFCYDSGHENAFTPNHYFLESYAKRLITMHLHDNDGKNDLHLLPFDTNGTINWQEKMALLNKTKPFETSVILEAENKTEQYEIFLKNAYESALKFNRPIV
ncbi:MAG: sugar phosphate isomerase/epimerase [Ruminococcaceae bacterium]|nr:sugar phosphate isomerase/epimerase [Oscillospiraceae bacterium]